MKECDAIIDECELKDRANATNDEKTPRQYQQNDKEKWTAKAVGEPSCLRETSTAATHKNVDVNVAVHNSKYSQKLMTDGP